MLRLDIFSTLCCAGVHCPEEGLVLGQVTPPQRLPGIIHALNLHDQKGFIIPVCGHMGLFYPDIRTTGPAGKG